MAEKGAGGRPPKNFDQEDFEKLCRLMCTRDEICAWFSTTSKTLDNWCVRTYDKRFSTVYKELSALGKMSLRRSQFRLAEHNASMAIFLGKQYLGQRDNPDKEERDARLAILKAQADNAGTASTTGRQVIILNDTTQPNYGTD